MSGAKLDGYEIHMGETIFSDKDAADHKMMVQICDQVTGESRCDGAQKKNVYGCYLHAHFCLRVHCIRFLQMQFVRIWI